MNEKIKFANRLNLALDRANIAKKGKGRQLQMAELFKVSQESARKWLEGKSFPDTKRIFEIAQQLQVSPEWLLFGIGTPDKAVSESTAVGNSPNWVKVPILTWKEAGEWEVALPKKYALPRDNWVWTEADIGKNAYALIVESDDMMPRYEPNSLLIVDPEYVPTHKHKVIYLLAEEQTVTCKQLIIDGKRSYLKPHSPLYPALLLTEKDKYCGTIRQVRMKY